MTKKKEEKKVVRYTSLCAINALISADWNPRPHEPLLPSPLIMQQLPHDQDFEQIPLRLQQQLGTVEQSWEMQVCRNCGCLYIEAEHVKNVMANVVSQIRQQQR